MGARLALLPLPRLLGQLRTGTSLFLDGIGLSYAFDMFPRLPGPHSPIIFPRAHQAPSFSYL